MNDLIDVRNDNRRTYRYSSSVSFVSRCSEFNQTNYINNLNVHFSFNRLVHSFCGIMLLIAFINLSLFANSDGVIKSSLLVKDVHVAFGKSYTFYKFDLLSYIRNITRSVEIGSLLGGLDSLNFNFDTVANGFKSVANILILLVNMMLFSPMKLLVFIFDFLTAIFGFIINSNSFGNFYKFGIPFIPM